MKYFYNWWGYLCSFGMFVIVGVVENLFVIVKNVWIMMLKSNEYV